LDLSPLEYELSFSQIEDLQLAASQLRGAKRRSFQAEMALKYCGGSARLTETVLGWGRNNVALGLAEKRTRITCIGAQAAFGGNKSWEERYPEAAASLREIAEAHAQQDPSFLTTIAVHSLNGHCCDWTTALIGLSKGASARSQYNGFDFESDGLPFAPGGQSQTQKKIPETDAIFDNIQAQDQQADSKSVKRLSMDCKATVNIGDFSRGGQTRGDDRAGDHDFATGEKYIPCGIVDQDNGHMHLVFGSSGKTSDFIVDTLSEWWKDLTPDQQQQTQSIQLKVDNGPESSGVRTQFLKRMVEFVDQIGKPLHLLYYPPYHSKYNPIERCWGILEKHWNGAKLTDPLTMLLWAQSMTWKGVHPTVKLNIKTYQTGISLTKTAMRSIERRLERHPLLPKWDILIRPAWKVFLFLETA